MEAKIPDLAAVMVEMRPIVSRVTTSVAMDEFDDMLDSAHYRAPEEWALLGRVLLWLETYVGPDSPVFPKTSAIWLDFIKTYDTWIRQLKVKTTGN